MVMEQLNNSESTMRMPVRITAPAMLMEDLSAMAKKPAITPPEVWSMPVFHSSTTMGKPHSI